MSVDGNESDQLESTPAPSSGVEKDVLERLLERVRGGDAADAPDVAGAIASVLAARLEGSPIPEEVAALVERLEDTAEPSP